MRLWVLTFDESKFENESPHSFSWGEARHFTADDIDDEMVERGWGAQSGNHIVSRTTVRAVLEATLVEREQDSEPEYESKADELLDAAWGIIANAGWDGLDKTEGWQEAAVRWRDKYHEWLDK